jgi:hypothetical protein
MHNVCLPIADDILKVSCKELVGLHSIDPVRECARLRISVVSNGSQISAVVADVDVRCECLFVGWVGRVRCSNIHFVDSVAKVLERGAARPLFKHVLTPLQ